MLTAQVKFIEEIKFFLTAAEKVAKGGDPDAFAEFEKRLKIMFALGDISEKTYRVVKEIAKELSPQPKPPTQRPRPIATSIPGSCGSQQRSC